MSTSRSITVFIASLLLVPYALTPLQVFSASTDGISISVTDGRKTINAGGTLIYAVTVSNQSDDQETVSVSLELPDYTTIVSPSNGGELHSGKVLWSNLTLSADTSITLNVQVTLLPTVDDGTVLTATAMADGMTAVDKTTVGTSAVPNNSFHLSLTDGKSTVSPTEDVTYVATVKNTSNVDETVDIHMSLGEFVTIEDIDADAYVNNRSITWFNVTIEAGASETFTVDATIDRFAAEYFLITTKLQAGGVTDTDVTSVQTNVDDLMNSDDDEDDDAEVRFSVTPTATEVLPGGRIRYTVSVRNTGDATLDDLTATVKFDPSVAILVNAGSAQKVDASTIKWNIPNLAAGKTWNTSFELALVDGLPLGTVIPVVSTLQGSSIDSITLQSRVSVTSVALIGTLPATGYPLDTLATFLLLPFAALAAGFQRRLRMV
jgi:uncharacterized membrane protein